MLLTSCHHNYAGNVLIPGTITLCCGCGCPIEPSSSVGQVPSQKTPNAVYPGTQITTAVASQLAQ